MTNPIVTVNVTQTVAPVPDQLQKRGAIISQGGTTLAAGASQFLTQASDLTAILSATATLATVAWASTYGGLVTATTTSPHNIPIGQQFVTTISGATPSGYNGTFNAVATGASTFTYYLAANPGSGVTAGSYTPKNQAEVVSAVNTFFGQGTQQGVYVLELGAGTVGAGVTALAAFITANPGTFYGYLVPKSWDGNAAFIAFAALFASPTSLTYFFVTTNPQNYGLYPVTSKSLFLFTEAPTYGRWASNVLTAASFSAGVVTATTTIPHGIIPNQLFQITGCTPSGYNGYFVALPGTTGSTIIYAPPGGDPGSNTVLGTVVQSTYAASPPPPTEFTLAATFQHILNYNPSSTNKVAPLAFSNMYGVTSFPQQGNASLLALLKAASVSYAFLYAEGGVTNNIILFGHTKDTRPFNYWYALDWLQINTQVAVTVDVINGSNNPINPLYYNQDGINRLEAVVAGVCSSAVTFGLALGSVQQVGLDAPTFLNNLNRGDYAGQVVVNAIPFVPYARANPTHYRQGIYNGLSVTVTPQVGFESITFNINATDFVAA